MPEDKDRTETPSERVERARNAARSELYPGGLPEPETPGQWATQGRDAVRVPRPPQDYSTGAGTSELQELRAIRALLERVVELLEADRENR